MTFFLIYAYFCLMVGLLGYRSRAGILGTTLLAFVFTPLIALVFVLALVRWPDAPQSH